MDWFVIGKDKGLLPFRRQAIILIKPYLQNKMQCKIDILLNSDGIWRNSG